MHQRWLLSVVVIASVVGQSGWQQLQPLHALSARGSARFGGHTPLGVASVMHRSRALLLGRLADGSTE